MYTTDYTKCCRVCMKLGSRDIFYVQGQNSFRLLEKLRYVSMMKIEENDDLPRLLCDLCIVHLNVAYDFKRHAVENDTKLRQYYIEHGITSNQPAPNLNDSMGPINTVLLNHDVSNIRNSFTSANKLSPPSPKINTTPIMPIIVKTEPEDVFTNKVPFTSTPSVSNSSAEKKFQLNENSMVYINGYSFDSLTPCSDIELVQNINKTHPMQSSGIIVLNKDAINLKSGNSQKDSPPKQPKTSAKQTRKKIAKRRLGHVICRDTISNEVKRLSIAMNDKPIRNNKRNDVKKTVNNQEAPTEYRKLRSRKDDKERTTSNRIFFNPFNNVEKNSKRKTNYNKMPLLKPKLEPGLKERKVI